MRLKSRSSDEEVILTPLGYEFADGDDSWIVIQGVVTTREEQWTFRVPALIVREVAGLATWLRSAARGDIPPSAADAEPTLSFLEPCLGISVQDVSVGWLTLRVHLRYESAPPSTFRSAVNSEGRHFLRKTDSGHFVEIEMTSASLLQAAEELEVEASKFPQRAEDY